MEDFKKNENPEATNGISIMFIPFVFYKNIKIKT